MALLTWFTRLSTTFGSSESSRDKSIELSSAKSCFSWVTGGGFHAGTDGLPGRSAAGGLKGAEGAMMESDGMICRWMFLGLMLMSLITSGAAQPCLISFAAWARVHCDFRARLQKKERPLVWDSQLDNTMKLRNRFLSAIKAWLEWPDVLDARLHWARNNHSSRYASHCRLTSVTYASSTCQNVLPVLPALI